MKKESKRYYKILQQLFPTLNNQEKKFLELFKQRLQQYEINHPDDLYDDYLEHFGDPVDIVSAYYEHIESEYIIKHMKSRTIVKRVLCTFLTIVIIFAIYIAIIVYKLYVTMQDEMPVYEQTTITEYTTQTDE